MFCEGGNMSHLHHHHAHTLENLAPATSGRLIRWANHYDLFVNIFAGGRRAQLRESTVNLAGIQSGDIVLEVGCGTGDVALAASARAGVQGAVYGIDPSPE